MQYRLKQQWINVSAIVCFCLLLVTPAQAVDDFFLYGNQGAENVIEQNIPEVNGSYFTAVDYFRAGPNEGKMLAATGTDVFIQDTIGGSTWTKVAKVENNMDPAFVRVSPSGTQIALGLGYNQDILVFDASILNSTTPTDLNINPNPDVKVYQENHYDAAWVEETHLVINGGQWVVQGQSAVSGVTSLDVTNASSISQGLCGNISGASSSIAVDGNKNLVFGIGAGTNTGELKVWPASEWWVDNAPITTVLDYSSTGLKFADSILSAAYLGFDSEGNLHAGGGEFLNPPPGQVNLESGYAALIKAKVISDAVDSSVPLYEVDETKADQYREFSPDVCRNDTATGAIPTPRGLAVLWNPATAPGSANCVIGGNNDWWAAGVAPKVTEYRVNTTMDTDGDGFVDVVDYSPGTSHTANVDTDGDGYGNIIDADFNNDGIVNGQDSREMRNTMGTTNAETDLNSDNIVNGQDNRILRSLFAKQAPYYNL
jgi:hypothetical protein